jgi:tRNA threonylcarbamoyladenosine biosynthesis protein TsaB
VIALGIDGALGPFSAALADEGGPFAARSESGNVALERGLPIVRDLLASHGIAPPAGLDRIGIGIGPGGFTGLRVAIAYAKSLAQAWNVPLVPVSSFDALELGHSFDRVLAVVSGRPGVISARYRDGSATVRRASGRIAEVLDEIAIAGDPGLPVVGAPKDVLAALAERGIVVQSFEPPYVPAAAAVATIARTSEPARSVHDVRADYGELPAARVPERRTLR